MTRPICDTCTAQHTVIGNDAFIVKCSIKCERWAPMVDEARKAVGR